MKLQLNRSFLELTTIALLICLGVYFILSLNIIAGLLSFLFVFFLFKKRPKILFIFFLLFVFFQNTFLSIFSSLIQSQETFNLLHGVNFFALAVLFFVFIIENKMSLRKVDFMNVSLSICLLLLAFFIFGTFHFGIKNSASYLRLFTAPIFALFAGLYFSKRIEEYFLFSYLKNLFVICALIAFIQVFFPKLMGYFLNELAYYKLKKGITNWDELLNFYGRHNLFNISWIQIKAVRIGSLIKSMISLGYFLTILGFYYYWPKHKFKFFLILMTVILAVNSKGVLLMIFFIILLYFFIYKTNLSKSLAYILYGVFISAFVIVGYLNNNEHILGLVNGFSYLSTFGNGIGFSGNVSDILLTSWDGKPLKDIGYWTRFQNGSESVYGVLFSSLGIFSVVYIIYFLIVIYLAGNIKSNNTQIKILKILTVVLFVQGIFQEEAFSPYAFGLVMFLVGLNYKVSHTIGKKEFEKE
ncbi:hypothetical protein [Aquimarina intermedia]|uniref:O-antigen ligase-like membrane protein n=1 Tax=Aquimarina intermedia TaxID=350814 RepID=A0A5S5CBX0_9FLAO|nr:hypothetical protein [Aquimarina intermedia]TYP76871.1 hypothetical protein BD809_10116 [Aquimarina intermedia]